MPAAISAILQLMTGCNIDYGLQVPNLTAEHESGLMHIPF